LEPLLDPLLSASVKKGAVAKSSSQSASPRIEDSEIGEILESWGLVGDEIIRDQAMKESLEALTPGAGFRCLVLLLFQHLLSCKEGYDSRIRHSLKRLGVAVLVHSRNDTKGEKDDVRDYIKLSARATRRYESLERLIGARLLHLAAESDQKSTGKDDNEKNDGGKGTSVKDNVVRGLKIGAVGVAAGTLIFVTGGVAAAAVAAGGLSTGLSTGLSAVGLSAFVGVSSGVLAFMSTTAAVSIFGTAGGSLAMYKMKRRTDGLTEFSIQEEGVESKKIGEAELHRTICISGWLRDKHDFQRPWGVHPSNPPLMEKQELLERFYAIHNPVLVPDSKKILEKYDGKERLLWLKLNEKYKSYPENLFHLDYGPRFDGALNGEEATILDTLVLEVASRLSDAKKSKNNMKKAKKHISKFCRGDQQTNIPEQARKSNMTNCAGKSEESKSTDANSEPIKMKINLLLPPPPPQVSEFEEVSSEYDLTSFIIDTTNGSSDRKHLSTVWDFLANYGGELYTVKWESDVMLQVNNSVQKIALDLAETAGKEILKKTAFASLVIASAWPLAIYKQIDNIDGDWKLITGRSKEAGKELAKSLLTNTKSGHRPVTLVGYSFGALVIYSCLMELAKYQEEWFERQKDVMAQHARHSEKNTKKPSLKQKLKQTKKGEKNQLGFDLEPASIIEDVVFMGLPKYLNLKKWEKCREIVSGRLVNVYCCNDKILMLLFRYKNLKGSYKPICGTCAVAVPGVESIDATHIVKGNHADYCLLVGDILKQIRFGQPLRSDWKAVDEIALIAETERKIEDFN